MFRKASSKAFIPFHFAETTANLLTNDALDPEVQRCAGLPREEKRPSETIQYLLVRGRYQGLSQGNLSNA